MPARLTLAPGVPDLAALGASSVDDVLGAGGGLEGESRCEEVAAEGGTTLLRCPLPGTLAGRPRGAGTGWVLVRRYHGGSLRERVAARLTSPRSDSLASREWNLLCHLRAAGVTTPEPMAVAAEGGGFLARRSALVTRALEGVTPAPEWFSRRRRPRERRDALRAVGLALSRVLRSGTELPRLSAAEIALSEPGDATRAETGPDACALEQVVAARPVTLSGGLSWRRLPDVAVTSVRGGRLRRRARPAAVAATLERLSRGAGDALDAREKLKVALLATRRCLPRRARKRVLRRLVGGTVWTRSRVLIALALLAHWTAVGVWSLPDWTGLRERLLGVEAPLPLVNTHRGEPWLELRRQSPLRAYLAVTAHAHRWRMFVPRRPNTTYLELSIETRSGRKLRYRLAERTGGASLLGSRWRLLEAALLNPEHRSTFVPVVVPRLARYLAPEPLRSVEAVKRGYPVPLLAPDGSGNPPFTSAADYRRVLAAAEERFLGIPLGTYVFVPGAQAGRE